MLYIRDIHNNKHNLAAPQGTSHGTPDSPPSLGTDTVIDYVQTTFPVVPILATVHTRILPSKPFVS